MRIRDKKDCDTRKSGIDEVGFHSFEVLVGYIELSFFSQGTNLVMAPGKRI